MEPLKCYTKPMQAQDWTHKIHESIAKEYSQQQRILSFDEYMLFLGKNPQQQVRSSAQYIVDMMNYFGRTDDRFNIFDQKFTDSRFKLIGLEEVQQKIYAILQSFIREGMNNKLILLHGPNGSAKSSLITCLMRGLEEYSHKPQGALYRFHWIFPVDKYGKSALGFGKNTDREQYSSNTYAKLEGDDIAARISCDLKDHPLFLIPREERKDLVNSLLENKENGKEERFHVSEYILKGDLSHKSRLIYEALLQSYKGDYSKVLKHIQVERFYISKRYRQGAVTIEPQLQVDANAQQVTMDKSFSQLPASLQSLNLVNVGGDLVDGNRGMIEYNDILKRPIEAFKYLMGTCESGTINVAGTTVFLDGLMIGTCNELQLDGFKEYPDFMSFKARMELVRVPYLLTIQEEKEIYSTQISRVAGDHHVAPHTLELAAIWAILCRMKKPNPGNYPGNLAYLFNGLTPWNKACLYNGEKVPSTFSEEDKKLLRSNMDLIRQEYRNIPYYEGRTGPSPREIKLILFDALGRSENNILSPLGLFSALTDFVKHTSEYEFLRESATAGYHDAVAFIDKIEDIYLNLIDDEVRSSLGMYDEKQFSQFLEKYINHVSHFLKKEKLRNPNTNQMESPDESLMDEFERVVNISENKGTFRENIITQIGVYSLENPEETPKTGNNYVEIFPALVKKMRDYYQNEQSSLLRSTHEAMVAYVVDGKQPQTGDQKEGEQLARTLLKNMEERFSYTPVSAREAFSYLVQKRN